MGTAPTCSLGLLTGVCCLPSRGPNFAGRDARPLRSAQRVVTHAAVRCIGFATFSVSRPELSLIMGRGLAGLAVGPLMSAIKAYAIWLPVECLLLTMARCWRPLRRSMNDSSGSDGMKHA